MLKSQADILSRKLSRLGLEYMIESFPRGTKTGWRLLVAFPDSLQFCFVSRLVCECVLRVYAHDGNGSELLASGDFVWRDGFVVYSRDDLEKLPKIEYVQGVLF